MKACEQMEASFDVIKKLSSFIENSKYDDMVKKAEGCAFLAMIRDAIC